MDDQKMSDKRKAPDRESSTEDLSLVAQAPNKKVQTDLQGEQEDLIISPTSKQMESLQKHSNEVETKDFVVVEQPLSVIQTPQNQIIVQVNNSSTSGENGKEHITGENHEANENGTFFLETKEQEVQVSPEDNNNEHNPTKTKNGDRKAGNGKSQLKVVTSSPLSQNETGDKSKSSESLDIQLRAYAGTGKNRRLIYDTPNLKSDFNKLQTFLMEHNVHLPQTSLSGNLGDISFQDSFLPSGGGNGGGVGPGGSGLATANRSNSSSSSYSGHRTRSGWTSSTLGSLIPRENIKTIYTISPNESPDDHDKNDSLDKKRGSRNGPKMTSTKLSEVSMNSFERDKTPKGVNGESPSPPRKKEGDKSKLSKPAVKAKSTASSDKTKKSFNNSSSSSTTKTPTSRGKATPTASSSKSQKPLPPKVGALASKAPPKPGTVVLRSPTKAVGVVVKSPQKSSVISSKSPPSKPTGAVGLKSPSKGGSPSVKLQSKSGTVRPKSPPRSSRAKGSSSRSPPRGARSTSRGNTSSGSSKSPLRTPGSRSPQRHTTSTSERSPQRRTASTSERSPSRRTPSASGRSPSRRTPSASGRSPSRRTPSTSGRSPSRRTPSTSERSPSRGIVTSRSPQRGTKSPQRIGRKSVEEKTSSKSTSTSHEKCLITRGPRQPGGLKEKLMMRKLGNR